MKARCKLTGFIHEFVLLDAVEYKRGSPAWAKVDVQKALGRPLLFEGKRWCYRGNNGAWISLSQDKFDYEFEKIN